MIPNYEGRTLDFQLSTEVEEEKVQSFQSFFRMKKDWKNWNCGR